MNLMMVTKEFFINPEYIKFIRITGDYSIYLEGNSLMKCDLNTKDILAVDYVKDELIPLLKGSAYE